MTAFKKNSNFYIILIFCIIAAFVYLFIGINYGLNVYDEAIGIVGAERVAAGELPYQDFWTIYAPGQFYFYGFMLSDMNWTIISERITTVVLMVFTAVFIYFNARSFSSKPLALIALAFAVIFAGLTPFYGRAVPPALFAVLFSLYLSFKYMESTNNIYLFSSGFLTALAMLFRHDFGFYLFVASTAVIFFFSAANSSWKSKIKKSLTASVSLLIYFLGAATLLIPALMFLFTSIPPATVFHHLFEIPVTVFSDYKSLPFPVPFVPENYIYLDNSLRSILLAGWNGIVFYLPLIIYLLTGYFLYKDIKAAKIRIDSSLFSKNLLIIAAGILFYGQTLVRSEVEHAIPTIFISAVLLPSLLVRFNKGFLSRIIVSAVLVLLVAYPVSKKIRDALNSISDKHSKWMDTERAYGVSAEKAWAEDYEKTIQYIQQYSNKEDKIYVGKESHDRLILNDIMLYFLADRLPGTRYHELHPGITTTRKVQQEIISELKNNNVKLVVLSKNAAFLEPNKSSISSGVYDLDNFIDSSYYTIETSGNYRILLRR